MVAAIVLAAGKSERMGRAKALLPLGGHTFLENILNAVAKSSIGQTVVVLGHHREAIEQAVQLERAVFNPNYEMGMITSIQAGIRDLSTDTDGALLFLVDHPVVAPATIEALLQRFEPGHIVIPTYQGRRGHPVLFSREVFGEILALPVSDGANVVVRKDASRVIEVPVNDPGVTMDIDTPEQFERLERRSI